MAEGFKPVTTTCLKVECFEKRLFLVQVAALCSQTATKKQTKRKMQIIFNLIYVKASLPGEPGIKTLLMLILAALNK